MKLITLCKFLCYSSSRFPASIIQNIVEFGAKNYFTDHRAANTIHGFRDSVPVLKIHGCYKNTQKSEQLSILVSIQAIQGNYSVLM